MSEPSGILVRALALTTVGSLLSCSPAYVARAAWEEARILMRRQPIAEILDDAALDPATRAKLELVVETRSFAQRELRLDVGDSYTSFADIGRDTLALVLSASPADRLAAHTWWFPIVGRVPYKGFFSRKAALAEKRGLEEKGYDTYLRITSAFSTLGWLPDPLLSTVLRRDSVGLAETVIHEVTHNTLFVSGHVKFNESFANFVGSVGAVEFFCGRDARLCERARARWHDSLLFGAFLDSLWVDLEGLYGRTLSRDSTVALRRVLLREKAATYRSDYAPRMRSRGLARYDPETLNNASLIARHLYYHRLDRFQTLYEQVGDLARAVELLRSAVREVDDPWRALEGLRAGADMPELDAAGIEKQGVPGHN